MWESMVKGRKSEAEGSSSPRPAQLASHYHCCLLAPTHHFLPLHTQPHSQPAVMQLLLHKHRLVARPLLLLHRRALSSSSSPPPPPPVAGGYVAAIIITLVPLPLACRTPTAALPLSLALLLSIPLPLIARSRPPSHPLCRTTAGFYFNLLPPPSLPPLPSSLPQSNSRRWAKAARSACVCTVFLPRSPLLVRGSTIRSC